MIRGERGGNALTPPFLAGSPADRRIFGRAGWVLRPLKIFGRPRETTPGRKTADVNSFTVTPESIFAEAHPQGPAHLDKGRQPFLHAKARGRVPNRGRRRGGGPMRPSNADRTQPGRGRPVLRHGAHGRRGRVDRVPDYAIFADAHWEPPSVYEHIDEDSVATFLAGKQTDRVVVPPVSSELESVTVVEQFAGVVRVRPRNVIARQKVCCLLNR